MSRAGPSTMSVRRARWLSATVIVAAGAPAPAQVRLTKQATPFAAAPSTVITQPPGEARRLYQAVRSGEVRVVRDGVLLATPVLTIDDVQFGGECGLLGMAFHPQFASNGYMYVLYQTLTSPIGTRITRYTLDPASPDTVLPGSGAPILTIDRDPTINHQGGWLGFGPDGYLYISSGNGGVQSNSSSLTTMLGKVLRIDVNHDDFPADTLRNYSVPPTNPLAGSPNLAREIWATGLRNPWRPSFDRGTGDLWIADVGDITWEEFNVQPAIGQPPYTLRDYGYPCFEGPDCDCTPTVCASGFDTKPVYSYPRSMGFANVGGFVYRGDAIPALRGTYIFADYSGPIYSLRYTAQNGVTEFRTLTTDLGVGHLFSLGEDNAGELYLCTEAGPVYRIIPRCKPDCDGSTVAPFLNVGDFTCFLQRYAAADNYANCDSSTTPPRINVGDFTCFLQKYAAGCS